MSFARRLSEVREAVARACGRAGRDPSEVRLLAVSKFQPPELIEEAYAAGVRDFGENYVQALTERAQTFAHLGEARWHFIGHLQSNKAKQVLAHAASFQALDSERLAAELGARAAALAKVAPWPVFIQVNLEGEASKSGVAPDDVTALARAVRAFPSLKLAGLMCIPEPQDTAERMRPAFRALRELAAKLGGGLELSMGMSDDFEVAIEEGAHWIRVGRRLFGDRPAAP